MVNRVYSGMTLLFSASRTSSPTRTWPARCAPNSCASSRPARCSPNSRAGMTPRTSTCTPWSRRTSWCAREISHRPAAEQIDMDDLSVEHEPVTDRLLLRSRRLDAEVIPVYLGFLLPMALPEVQQVLLTFAYLGMAQPDLWAGTTVPLPGRGIAGYPRIVHGDLVLQRRMWKLHPDHLPTRTPGQGDAEWFLGWQRWRRDNGLPGASSPPRRAPGSPGGRWRQRTTSGAAGPQAALRGLRQPLLAAPVGRDGACGRQSTRADRDAAGPRRAGGTRRRRHVRDRADSGTQRRPRQRPRRSER
ncbi:lantibiotic dehydratase [Micromonospora sp. M12]